MARVGLPRVGKDPQCLVHLLQLALQLILEDLRLVGHVGADPRLCLDALGVRGA